MRNGRSRTDQTRPVPPAASESATVTRRKMRGAGQWDFFVVCSAACFASSGCARVVLSETCPPLPK